MAIVLIGVLVRLAFALRMMSHSLPSDAMFFHQAAVNVASGRGYANAGSGTATAGHPPSFAMLLAMFDVLGLRSIGAQRIAMALLASAGVLVVGLLGRRLATPAVGLVAAGIAAVDPFWFQPCGILMSESIYLVVVPLLLLAALRCMDHPTRCRFIVVGAIVAAAVLIRSEAIGFVLLLGVPLLLLSVVIWRERVICGVAYAVGLSLLLGPWIIRNEIQIGGPTLSTNGGVTLAGSYCLSTFDPRSDEYGAFDLACSLLEAHSLSRTRPPGHASTWSELALSNALTAKAEQFARGHLGEMPGVVVAREEAVWGFGNQRYQLGLAVAEGRDRTDEQLGQVLFWILLPMVVLGAFTTAKRSGRRFVVIAVPLIVVALNAALFYGSTRVRTAAEPSLAVLAAVGAVTTFSRIQLVLRS